MFVFNDGALCWGFPHFLPLIVLIPRGRGGLGPGWVGYTVPAKLQMICQIHHACLQIGNRPRARCVVSIRPKRERQITTKAEGKALRRDHLTPEHGEPRVRATSGDKLPRDPVVDKAFPELEIMDQSSPARTQLVLNVSRCYTCRYGLQFLFLVIL